MSIHFDELRLSYPENWEGSEKIETLIFYILYFAHKGNKMELVIN